MSRKVRSTAPRRKSAVRAHSFGKSFDKLHYVFNDAAGDKSDAQKIALWNRYIPLTPTKAAKILLRDLPEDATVTFELDQDGTGEILISAYAKFKDDGSFDLEDKLLDAGLVRVEDDYKGQGIGRTLFRNQIEFFYACGVRKFEVNATLENGGYTWARVGFLPDDVKDGVFRDEVAIPARESMRKLGNLLSVEERRELRKHLKFKKPKDLWHVADTDIDIGPRLKDVFEKAASPDVPEKKREKAKAMVKSLRDHFAGERYEYMKERAQAGESVMVGRLLLTGTSWNGSIDMDDPKQMKRVGKYAGGFKYLEIK